MLHPLRAFLLRISVSLAAAYAVAGSMRADDTADKLQALAEQNRRLEATVEAQAKAIAALQAKMAELQQTTAHQADQLSGVEQRVEATPAPRAEPETTSD